MSHTLLSIKIGHLIAVSWRKYPSYFADYYLSIIEFETANDEKATIIVCFLAFMAILFHYNLNFQPSRTVWRPSRDKFNLKGRYSPWGYFLFFANWQTQTQTRTDRYYFGEILLFFCDIYNFMFVMYEQQDRVLLSYARFEKYFLPLQANINFVIR